LEALLYVSSVFLVSLYLLFYAVFLLLIAVKESPERGNLSRDSKN